MLRVPPVLHKFSLILLAWACSACLPSGTLSFGGGDGQSYGLQRAFPPYFQTMDTLTLSSGMVSNGSATAIDSAGRIYVAGYAMDSSAHMFWIVRMSPDHGTTWSSLDSFQYFAGFNSQAQAIAIANNGNILVGGLGTDDVDAPYGIVRMSSDHGATWSTVDVFSIVSHSGNNNGVNAITVSATGVIYSVGSKGGWFVRKSTDGGVTWSAIDSYTLSGPTAAATAISIDPIGNIYVAGFGLDASGVWNWIVRRSTLASDSIWTNADDYTYSAGYFAYPNTIAADSMGNIYVAGFEGIYVSGEYYPPSAWLVRKWSPAASSWSTVDSDVFNEATGYTATGVAVDGHGNVFVAGADHGAQWSVKGSTDGGNTWSIVDSPGGSWGASAIAAVGGTIVVSGQGNCAPPSASLWCTRVSSP